VERGSKPRDGTARAALKELEGKTPEVSAEILRREYRARMRRQHGAASLAGLQQNAALAPRRAW